MTGRDPVPVRLVRRWTILYTRGLSPEAGERRRLELESDMWEHRHDRDDRDVIGEIFGRFLRGIPADVRWRYRTLLEQRGARQRSQEMANSIRSNWWVLLTGAFGVATIVASLGAAVFAGGDGAIGFRIFGGASGTAAGGVVLVGLFIRERQVVAGSWLILAGFIVALDPLFLVPAALIVISGLWTARLQLTEPADEAVQPQVTQSADDGRVAMLRARQAKLTSRWYLWFVAAAVLLGIGFLFPLFVFNESSSPSTDSPTGLAAVADAGLWMAWWGSWLAAVTCAGVGVVMGALRGLVRHRTRFV